MKHMKHVLQVEAVYVCLCLCLQILHQMHVLRSLGREYLIIFPAVLAQFVMVLQTLEKLVQETYTAVNLLNHSFQVTESGMWFWDRRIR